MCMSQSHKFARPARAAGMITIQSTSNNTMLTLADEQGRTLAWTSAGALGFRNSRKSTTYGAQAAGEHIASRAHSLGMRRVHVRVKGLGYGKESSVRALAHAGIEIVSIMDITPTAHNGCRRPRQRRT
jgi:small subunit ribosomal protein S11